MSIASQIGRRSDETEYEMKPKHKKGWKLSPKQFAIWLGVVAVGGLGLSHITGLPYWGAMAIVAAALIVTGAVAEIEDRSPGGFLSADKRVSPPSVEPPRTR